MPHEIIWAVPVIPLAQALVSFYLYVLAQRRSTPRTAYLSLGSAITARSFLSVLAIQIGTVAGYGLRTALAVAGLGTLCWLLFVGLAARSAATSDTRHHA